MKRKICFVLGILLLLAGNVLAQGPGDIPIRKMPSDSIVKPKSPVYTPTPLVSLDGAELTFDFASATVSQVIIMDESNYCQVVYSGSFTSSTQVIIELDEEGLGEGHYLLWLFAFGEWWEGEFEIE